MGRHDLILDDLGHSELHAGLLARAAAVGMAASPARLHVQQPSQDVSRPTRHGAVPIRWLGMVDVFSAEGLVRARV
eukprot:12798660-Alexandrium_andersonii.AAC.1